MFMQHPLLYIPHMSSTAFSLEDDLRNLGVWRTTAKMIWDVQLDVLEAMNSAGHDSQLVCLQSVQNKNWSSMIIEYPEIWREAFEEFFLNTLQVRTSRTSCHLKICSLSIPVFIDTEKTCVASVSSRPSKSTRSPSGKLQIFCE